MKKTMMTLLTGALLIGTWIGYGGSTSAEGSSFRDVPASHWAKSAIDYAVSKGYLKGEGNGDFRPNAAVTRAELAAILDRVSSNTIKEGAASFSDLTGHWSEKEVKEAAGKGFFQSLDYPNGFKPGTAMTRVEMAQWMARGLGQAKVDYTKALEDTKDTLVPVAEYYKGGLNKSDYPYVSVALGTGLMTGYQDGTFGPSKTTTRAEVATILMRYETIQSKEANSFRDLNEMREVGLTGTNLTSLTPHRYGIDSDGIEHSFDKLVGKPFNLKLNKGTATVHRMIVVDGAADNTSVNLYGKMFVDKEFEWWSLASNRYFVFLDVTVTPNVATLGNQSFGESSPYPFLSGNQFKSGTERKFGITALPAGQDFVYSKFFEKGKPTRFWMVTFTNREYVSDFIRNGSFFEGVSFRIPAPIQ